MINKELKEITKLAENKEEFRKRFIEVNQLNKINSNKKEREKFLSSVYMIIKNELGEVLLQRRKGTNLWSGFLALPAGHIDKGEDAYEALIREAKEELGIHIKVEDIENVFVVNRKNESLEPYFDIYFEINKYEGLIEIKEPDKCSELIWIHPNEFPNDMIEFEKEAIKKNERGIKFSTIFVEKEKMLIKK